MTIKEIEAKSGLNLYRGCAHDCAYCDGRAKKYRVAGLAGGAPGTAGLYQELLSRFSSGA